MRDKKWKLLDINAWFTSLDAATKAKNLLESMLCEETEGDPSLRWAVYACKEGEDVPFRSNVPKIQEDEHKAFEDWLDFKNEKQYLEYVARDAETYCIETFCGEYVQQPSLFCTNHQDLLHNKKFHMEDDVVFCTATGEKIGYVGDLGLE